MILKQATIEGIPLHGSEKVLWLRLEYLQRDEFVNQWMLKLLSCKERSPLVTLFRGYWTTIWMCVYEIARQLLWMFFNCQKGLNKARNSLKYDHVIFTWILAINCMALSPHPCWSLWFCWIGNHSYCCCETVFTVPKTKPEGSTYFYWLEHKEKKK